MIDTTSLDRLAGRTVLGPDGEKIGKISDVYESTDGGGGPSPPYGRACSAPARASSRSTPPTCAETTSSCPTARPS
jgi:hypothetical protein